MGAPPAKMVKFSKDLQSGVVSRWSDHYMKYEKLNQVLKPMKAEEQSPDPADIEKEFEEAYEESLNVVNGFFNSKIAQYDEALTNYEQLANYNGTPAERTFFRTFREVGEFQTFIWLNATGFRKIMKKYDKRMQLRGTGNERQPAMEAKLSKEPFMGSHLEVILARAKSLSNVSNAQHDLKLIGGSGNRELAEEISGRLGIPLLKTDIKKFNDGEVSIKIQENIRNSDVYIIQPTCYPVNDNLMELLLTISALKRASVHYVIAVVPYYGYARQDRKSGSRVPISAADVARMMEAMGVDRVICVDLHAGQIQGFFGPCTPVDNLFAGPIAMEYFKTKSLHNPVIISPDAGGVARCKEFKEGLAENGMAGVTMAMIIKQREAAGVVGCMDLVGDVNDKDCIIVDDIIDTAGTLCAAANELKAFGARRVFAFATHGLFNGPAPDRINASALEEVAVANTVPLQVDCALKCKKIRVLSVGKLLSETIRRVHSGESLSAMFDSASAGSMFASAPLPRPRTDSCAGGGPDSPGLSPKVLAANLAPALNL